MNTFMYQINNILQYRRLNNASNEYGGSLAGY